MKQTKTSKSKELKILVCFERDCGGETIATKNIIDELRKHKKLVIISYCLDPLRKTDFLSYFSWIVGSTVKWFATIFQNRNVDWIYTTTYTAGAAAVLLKPIFTFRVCFHYHGSRLPEKEGKLTQKIKYKATFLLHQFFLKSADLVISPSSYSSRLLKKQFSQAVDKRIVAVPNGVDLKVFKPKPLKTKLSLRKKYNIKKDSRVVLAIGRLNKGKRIDLLLSVIRSLKDKISNISLLIAHPKAATDDERMFKRKLKKQITRLGISDYVLWLTGEKNIANIYAMSDLVVSASEKENFPLVMLEALASKVIFMSTPAGGVEDIMGKIDDRLIIRNLEAESVSKQIATIVNLADVERKTILRKQHRLSKEHSWQKNARTIYRYLSSSI